MEVASKENEVSNGPVYRTLALQFTIGNWNDLPLAYAQDWAQGGKEL